MKINEIRIGNWVDNGEGNHYIIDTSFFIDILDFSKDNSGETDLKPIPITEKWLLEFGFKNIHNQQALINNEWVKVYSFRNIEYFLDGEILIKGNCCLDSFVYLNPIKYVHQLQNLYFALTGEELTIIK